MLFSSITFIFVFLPCVLLGNLLLRRHRGLQNAFLTLCSLFFYAWGEPIFVLIMLASILINYILGILISRTKDRKSSDIGLTVLAVCINMGILFAFKYVGFALSNINTILGTAIPVPQIALPIGVSFFTFQALSYVLDVKRGKGEAQKNPMNVALYISFFPQLIAGPIVRYETIAQQIKNRKESFEGFSWGCCRFIVGLSKKVLLSNTMAVIADGAFGADILQLTTPLAWIGAIAYTLQIYFDFSGYSDMAIGLGRMLGFSFLENFDYPYISKSITEFWRRWHISLGTWFRDYVYIPLGGSKVTKARLVLNLFIVWLLTGIWHGANWTFVVWGLMYFLLLTVEKLTKFTEKLPSWAGWAYTMLFVILGWVFFKADNIAHGVAYIKAMTGFGAQGVGQAAVMYLNENLPWLAFAIIGSLPLSKLLKKPIERLNIAGDIMYALWMLLILLLSVACLVKGTYNPFIYFNF